MSEVVKYYAGVGSRETPQDVLNLMFALGGHLAKRGYILRTGGAKGADSAFADGAISCGHADKVEIYRPQHATEKARELAKKYHPAWHAMSDYSKNLHARNCFQVLGKHLNSPASYVVCWTPDGATTHASRGVRTGGTGTAISIADAYLIPVFNLKLQEHRELFEALLVSYPCEL